ncbi:N-acetylneuraminate synthase family protein [Candidatus Symbiobacter mobilis]|uniref:Sialic acid synthase n=1 Tax=Candidatus Symbiobacter mobilis CR TaxID=946483 RepID=U5N7W9_9BURK|nr:N-acetylneuraminate synthase family protein [Candidatus Symbiobacter mobilis]AGX87487.1 sialic acid synthase [Candidatus Symbiobacter mobilis CR]
MQNRIFEDLFVLEMASNHQGSVQRGLAIIERFSKIVRFNNVRAAIKLQFRDIDNFIHKDFVHRNDIRYIQRVTGTRLTKEEFTALVDAIRGSGCIPMSTPFDEKSVDWCVEFNMPIIKVASADNNDWTLLEKIATTRKPVIVSTGGMSKKDMDDLVAFFERRNIPLALNHCVAAYPHEDCECELGQIDYLRHRYPNLVIGYSCHEYRDWTASIQIAVAKGARTFERHIDIDDDGFQVAKYSSLPHQIDTWFKAWKKAKEMIGNSGMERRIPLAKEVDYLDSYVRGVYAKRDLVKGQLLTADDVYLAIPLQKKQISSRELMLGKYGHRLLADCKKDAPLTIDELDTPYSESAELCKSICERGL